MQKRVKVPCVFDTAKWKKFLARVQKLVWESQTGSTWQDLADKSGLSVVTVMNFAHSTTKQPGLLTVWKLCEALDIDVEFNRAGKKLGAELLRLDDYRRPRVLKVRPSNVVGGLRKFVA